MHHFAWFNNNQMNRIYKFLLCMFVPLQVFMYDDGISFFLLFLGNLQNVFHAAAAAAAAVVHITKYLWTFFIILLILAVAI